MKARIKKTGEIVEILQYGINGDWVNYLDESSKIVTSPLNYYQDFDFIEESKHIDWEQRRYEIAKEAMFHMIDPDVLTQKYCVMAVNAVEFANALITELKEARRPK